MILVHPGFRGLGWQVTGTIALVLISNIGVSSPSSENYHWRNVAIGGGGFVSGLIFHPTEKDLLYARTDVGGAYRWDDSVRRWIPITDWVGLDEVNFTGVESLALDPSDPNRVYLAVGTYSVGPSAILGSTDRGRTFHRTDVPFRMGGNEMGRFNGERLAVDPTKGSTLFFGSRRDGLWRSTDHAAHWSRVESVPNLWQGDTGLGIVSVVFGPEPGGNPNAIYIAASTERTNLFRSVDNAISWHAVPDQPVGLRPNHALFAPDGTLYLTYGKEPGPNRMTDGAVWKYDSKSGAWTDITPEKPGSDQPFGYGGVAVDAAHPGTVMVTTFAHWRPHDEIFRSLNGGKGWVNVWGTNTIWDHSNAPWTESRTPHWMGDIEINPFNSDQALFTTGYGIWSSQNITAADSGGATRWEFLDEGLEETVPLALVSPAEGPHLLSGLGDIDGFRHDDLDVPQQHTFVGPRYSNTEDLAFAGKQPMVIVRCGTGRNVVRAAISTNSGATWTALSTEPPGTGGGGAIAVSADADCVVWTPRRSGPFWTTNRGRTWTACSGLFDGARVLADPVNPSRFYAYNTRTGKLFESLNGAGRFVEVHSTMDSSELFPAGFLGTGESAVKLYSAPGREGDLWLASRAVGLARSSDGGHTFRKVTGVQQAISIGFGKPRVDGDSPAVYMMGRIGGVAALFRSDDTGANWARINNDAHRFGWIDHVTGDPRIYGRVYFGTGGRGVIYGDPGLRE